MTTPLDSSSKSIFWPLQFLVACLGIGMGFHLFELNRDRLVTERDIHELIGRGTEALAAKKSLFALIQEINDLAGRDAAAAQLLAEYNIQLRQNSAGSAGGN